MKKVLVLLLALALIFGTTSALADGDVTITLFHNKVEITSQLEAFAAEYSATHEGVTVKTEALGGGADYPSALKAKLQADQMPEIFVIDGLGDYQIWKDYCSDLSDHNIIQETDKACDSVLDNHRKGQKNQITVKGFISNKFFLCFG